jgi:hypothetical protein
MLALSTSILCSLPKQHCAQAVLNFEMGYIAKSALGANSVIFAAIAGNR